MESDIADIFILSTKRSVEAIISLLFSNGKKLVSNNISHTIIILPPICIFFFAFNNIQLWECRLDSTHVSLVYWLISRILFFTGNLFMSWNYLICFCSCPHLFQALKIRIGLITAFTIHYDKAIYRRQQEKPINSRACNYRNQNNTQSEI